MTTAKYRQKDTGGKLFVDYSERLLEQEVRTCRVCGCTDENCLGCIERTGEECYWVAADLCSACVDSTPGAECQGQKMKEVKHGE